MSVHERPELRHQLPTALLAGGEVRRSALLTALLDLTLYGVEVADDPQGLRRDLLVPAEGLIELAPRVLVAPNARARLRR